MNILLNYYEALLYSGKRVGFVTETSLDKLSDYNCLVIPGVSHTTQETLDAVKAFKNNGGKVIYYGDCLKYDKHGKSFEFLQFWLSGATKFTDRWAKNVTPMFADYFKDDRIKVIDNETGAAATDVEYIYDIKDDNNIVINLVKHSLTNTANVSVYLDGEPISGLRDVVTDEVLGENVELGSYVPRMLVLGDDSKPLENPKNLQYSDGMLTWNDDEKAVCYNVYHKGAYGGEKLYISTENNSCAVSGDGVYRVTSVNSFGIPNSGSRITVDNSLEISFDDINRSDRGVTASVIVKNTAPYYKNTVIKIMTSGGKLSLCEAVIAPFGKTKVTASFNIADELLTASAGNVIVYE